MSNLTPLQISIDKFYQKCMQWNKWAERIRYCLFIFGLSFVFFIDVHAVYPLSIALLSLIVELMEWHADTLYQKAEKMKISHELADGFGLYPTNTSLAEMGSNTAESSTVPDGMIYHTNEKTSPRRALKNLHESSFFSMNLAEKSAVKPLVTGSLIIIIGVLLMLYAPLLIDNFSDMRKMVLIATSLILSAFSLNLIKRGIALKSFSKTSKEICQKAADLLIPKRVTAFQVFPLLQEYQAERLLTPPIDSKLWLKHKDRLNKNYAQTFPTN